MALRYAKDQPPGFTNRIQRVAIVGAGGNIGKFIAKALVDTGIHLVTALTRKNSNSKMPLGVKVFQVDYAFEPSLVAALQGQQFLIITLAIAAPIGIHSKLVRAAAKAGVPYVMPNSYGIDIGNYALSTGSLLGALVRADCAEIEALGVSSWILLVCGTWYEYCLVCGPEWLGFDFKKKRVTFFDNGNTKTNFSTWEQCGRAIAAFLSLKELPEDENDQSGTVSRWNYKLLYISSFLLSQEDIFQSWKRVTGDRNVDWIINYEPTAVRYKRGIELLQKQDLKGFGLASYARIFYPNGGGNYEQAYGLANTLLRLPEEDLDLCTKHAMEVIYNCGDPRPSPQINNSGIHKTDIDIETQEKPRRTISAY